MNAFKKDVAHGEEPNCSQQKDLVSIKKSFLKEEGKPSVLCNDQAQCKDKEKETEITGQT